MRDILIILLLITIMSLNLFDIYIDSVMGVPSFHLIIEGLLVIASAAAATSLILKLNRQHRALLTTKQQLHDANTKMSQVSAEMDAARHKYSEVIQQQFDLWQLTTSEQEIALLMLKGLNFKEISVVRETKEKTVRQQASHIYAKAHVDGRHEFSAWFFEDFLA